MDKTPKIVSLTVGPSNVDEELKKCNSNRNRERLHVLTFVRLIKLGLFRDGGFVFADAKGKYGDAQHRFWALKITGHTAQFWVIQNLKPEDMNMMIDSGRKRTNADRLEAQQVPYASLICSAVEDIIELTDHWRGKKAYMLMPDEVLRYYHKNPDLQVLANNWSTNKPPEIQARFLVALQHVCTKIDSEKADQFFSDLTNRKLLKKGDPLFAFFELLKDERVVTQDSTARRNRYIKNGLLKAWSAFFRGQELDHITPTERPITLEGTSVEDNNSPLGESGFSAQEEEAEGEESQEETKG